ncbi:MAG: asparagine synthase (glutamine-hydrolyzing) [Desulfovibrionaceae bacterium]|nr:asparagine synthase (glutamine-hydrolyzing) [Desulfovibrionaceae bacterium]MBF0512481.1 asparagine synthase (glutamine-hydrolyzing) [Desulfovibrionaceae bacterium]
MCGIAGIVGDANPSELAEATDRLLRSLAHRGPDSQGTWSASRAQDRLRLVHTRLAIIDLSPAAAQPMADPATGNVIVFNGEIYNFRELRRDIEAARPARPAGPAERGAAFFSKSDTEVLLRGYALWGESLFSRLDGMFALLLYDHGGRKLIVARDHVGIKPLYYARTASGGLLFASEVRAIKNSGLWSGSVRAESLGDYLVSGAVREPYTILTGVYAFPPAHYAVVDLAVPGPELGQAVCYWDVAAACRGELPAGSSRSLETDHAGLLAATVEDQLVADVPVGIFLSAGIDSTALAEAAPLSVRPRLHAFTVSRRSAGVSEARLAALTAANLGIRHTVCDLSEEDVLAWTREGLAAMDQPSHDGVNVFLVSKASKQTGIIVALCGAGADELHGGYGHFATLAGLAAAARVPGLLPLMRAVVPAMANLRAGRAMADRAGLLLSAAPDIAAMVAEKRRFFTPGQIAALWPDHGRFRDRAEAEQTSQTGRAGALPLLSQISLAEISGYLKNTLLRDADWAAMANHQELRVPYLGKAYMELVLSVPWRLKARQGKINKPLLAGVISGQNRHVINRPKTGFELDYGLMLTGPLRGEFVQAAATLNSGYGFTLKPETMLRGLGDPGADKLARRVFALYALGSYLSRHGL